MSKIQPKAARIPTTMALTAMPRLMDSNRDAPDSAISCFPLSPAARADGILQYRQISEHILCARESLPSLIVSSQFFYQTGQLSEGRFLLRIVRVRLDAAVIGSGPAGCA